MKENLMSDFKTLETTDKGKKCSFQLKMNAPIGPKHATVEMYHVYHNFTAENGNEVLCSEIENKTLNFPYADYFDIIER